MKRILGLIVFASFQCIGADIHSIDVFVNHEQISQIKNCHDNCQIYDLDGTEILLNSFFGELSSDINDAYSDVEKKLNSSEWKTYESKIIEAQKTVIKAFNLGIKKYPAIVINEKNVIYGITDVARAIHDFNEGK
ncbi:TIGR03757 family integrating conjugative element protein [Gilliamella sp. B2776]|uniref:TIGR03757 family integrating conjugative element protein n=1 Tax=unclassified Gilliamella TaxID=2685620 RepID=UPI002269835E|nr:MULTISPECIES: TIGR03757 family integrating conjugative element protein [unclassified Gilliamella]MCX8578697.1 TIGR03757 family integrating conjugative element protein [Gilliamella sp. B2717]MCX8649579.1 TIGR03757 family integrating conjugative element protein [Gilliamella sp. B2779]MCX8654903.1 TIGR03757 family integrating conjugative element protein [Gilliamella sp. B2737]MCX8691431.1 TIGR03757 family integrating conjugative element protein [Gilliamella sp. B2776]MCX8702508.1 TIGR03757 fam